MIDIVLVDDHTIVRQGLRALLEAETDLRVVGEADNAEVALAMVRTAPPDVLVTDFALPGLDGASLIARCREIVPSARFVVLSMFKDDEIVRAAFEAGASGYLLKGSGIADLVRAVRCAHRGEVFVDPAVAAPLVPGRRGHETRLTPREREVLKLAAEGNTTRRIALRLSISPKTVEGHRTRLMAKIGVRDLQGLVRYAVRKHLVAMD